MVKEQERLCECGCGQELKGRVGVRFKRGHKNIGPKPTDIVICECGCGQKIPWNPRFIKKGCYPRFIDRHQNKVRKGKTNIELFGKEKGKTMGKKPEGFGEKISKYQLGKTLEERWGEKKAFEARLKMSKSASRPYEERFGEEMALKIKENRRRNIKYMHNANRERRKKHLKSNSGALNKCKCGCEGYIKSDIKESQFLPGHQNRIPGTHNKGLIKAKYFHRKEEIVLCDCGCNEKIEWKDSYAYHDFPKYKWQHHMRIPREILYGSKKAADKINKRISKTLKGRKKPEGFGENMSKRQFGKTSEELWGKESAINSKLKKSKYSSQAYEKKWGAETANKVKKERRNARLGKSYIELFGVEGAIEICKKQGDKDGYGRGKNETKILDAIEKEIIYKIDRNFWIATPEKEFFRPDGYIHEINTCVEIDEKHHKYQKKEDRERDRKIKKTLGCKIFRLKEKDVLQAIENIVDIAAYLINIDVNIFPNILKQY